MTSRFIEKCRPKQGLQAALSMNIQVHCILVNGLVIKFESDRQRLEWRVYYQYICGTTKREWSKEKWEQMGYQLIPRKLSPYKREVLTPRLIRPILTL